MIEPMKRWNLRSNAKAESRWQANENCWINSMKNLSLPLAQHQFFVPSNSEELSLSHVLTSADKLSWCRHHYNLHFSMQGHTLIWNTHARIMRYLWILDSLYSLYWKCVYSFFMHRMKYYVAVAVTAEERNVHAPRWPIRSCGKWWWWMQCKFQSILLGAITLLLRVRLCSRLINSLGFMCKFKWIFYFLFFQQERKYEMAVSCWEPSIDR